MERKSLLGDSIMRRVYAIWFVRRVLSPIFIKGAISLAFLWQLKEYVSVRNVVANAPSLVDVGASANFFASAFLNAEWLVQAMATGLFLAMALVAFDVIRGFSFYDGAIRHAWSRM